MLEELAGDVHPHLARLRSTEPVSWLPALGGWLVTARDPALEVLRDAETYTVDDPRFSTARVVGPSMLSTDGDEHGRHRAPFAPPFQAAVVRDGFEAWTAAEARRLVGQVARNLKARDLEERGRADLRAAVAGPLAVAVIARALGLVDDDPDRILCWYRAISAGVEGVNAGREVGDEARRAVADLRDEVDRTVTEATGSMLAEVAGDGSLTADEVFSNTAVVMFGAIETSEGMTSNALAHLLGAPDQLADVRTDRSLVEGAVEESLRMEPAATLVDRYATRDADLAGVDVRAGDLVTVSLAGANRDPATFPEPDRYDVARPEAHLQLAFVKGPHLCLGRHLARLQTIAAIEAVLDLLPDAVLDGTPDGEPPGARGLVFRKPTTVPIRRGG
ncbi:MAG: cytochrome P450 [Acidimicrobiaceae bacterium]|nr:cytochrome P450 [Acidimicrobiaceae bacterium]